MHPRLTTRSISFIIITNYNLYFKFFKVITFKMVFSPTFVNLLMI